MKDSDKIINKIKKCLALAKSSNINEATTALRQAQVLMQKHYGSATDLVPRQRKSTATEYASWKDSVAGSGAGKNANLSRGVNQQKSTTLESL